MKATSKGPRCGKVLTTDCEGCVGRGNAVHTCKGKKEWDAINVKWNVINCTKEEAEMIRKLGFKGKLPENLN